MASTFIGFPFLRSSTQSIGTPQRRRGGGEFTGDADEDIQLFASNCALAVQFSASEKEISSPRRPPTNLPAKRIVCVVIACNVVFFPPSDAEARSVG